MKVEQNLREQIESVGLRSEPTLSEVFVHKTT
jgi:hypothetical protein